MSEQLALLPRYLVAHLELTLLALFLGASISIPAGIWLVRHPRSRETALGVASVIQTIPSLALLAAMVPLLAALGGMTSRAFGIEIRSIGFLPSIIALTLYSLLPILRNTVTGIAGVEPALVDAARGLGMTPRQSLRRVELPLALPMIVAGLRTATVWVVGMATLSTPVGAPSLGNYIFTGLQTLDPNAILVGCFAAAGLALCLDNLIRLAETGLRERRSAPLAVATAVLGSLVVLTGAQALRGTFGSDAVAVRIGAKSYTEQYILSEILAAEVRRQTGAATEVLQALGSSVVYDALRTGQIDAYVDYSGTIWATHMKRTDSPGRETVLREVRAFLEQEEHLRLVAVLGFENAYALAVRATEPVERIGDLAPRAPAMEIGGDYQFFSRAEWRSIRETYGLRFRKRRTMDPAFMYEAVARKEVDVISAYTTDGRIDAFDLKVLVDDRGAIPPYDAIVITRGDLEADRPEVVAALASLEGRIDVETMRGMNFAVDEKGRTPREVAGELVDSLSEPY